MSAPARNAFVGKTTRPSDADLEKALGRAKPLWDQLVAELASEHGVTTREWKSYGAKSGCSLRLMRGTRTIVWLTPYAGCFDVAFIFGEKALTAIRQSAVPARVLRMLDDAPKADRSRQNAPVRRAKTADPERYLRRPGSARRGLRKNFQHERGVRRATDSGLRSRRTCTCRRTARADGCRRWP